MQPGNGRLRGKVAINVIWWFGSPKDWPSTSPPFAFWKRARRGPPGSGAETWASKDETLAAILPPTIEFLDEYRSCRAVLLAVESGELSAVDAFGEDQGWRLFNWALAARIAGSHGLEREKLLALADVRAKYRSGAYEEMLALGARRLDAPR